MGRAPDSGAVQTMNRIQDILIIAAAFFLPVTRASAQTAKPDSSSKSENPLVTALSFSHRYANPKALVPGNDHSVKMTLIAALKEDSMGLRWNSVRGLF